MAAHANAVAKDGAAGERRGGIDCDEAKGLLALAVLPGERIDERALAGAGRSREADDAGAARVGEQRLEQMMRIGGAVFHRGDGAR